MFNSKNHIRMFTLLVLLTATVLMAAGGSARFQVEKPLFAAGTEIAPGDYNVKWEPKGEEASVVFTPVGKPKGITVQGKIEQADKKYEFDSMAVGKDSAGRLAIKQLQFGGKKIRIVFE
jgi:hypothetical protein